jgi:transposase
MLKPESTHIDRTSQKSLHTCLPARKVMAAVFWDRKGVLMVEFMQQGTTMTSEVYCKTPEKPRRAIQNKRCGMLTSVVVLLRGNVRLHTAARTRLLLEHCSWELFVHPPYTPDLAPSYYHMFTYLKKWLGSQHLTNNEELMEGVKTYIINFFFLVAFFVNSSLEVTFRITLLFWPFSHHHVLTFSASSSAVLPCIRQCFYMGIISWLLYTNVMSCILSLLKLI